MTNTELESLQDKLITLPTGITEGNSSVIKSHLNDNNS